MPFRRLPHYLRTHRKKTGLDQTHVAALLGVTNGTTVSRYERFTRTPTLETALAFEVIFGVPVAELFAGLIEQVEREVILRAEAILERLAAERRTLRHPGRQAFLKRFSSLLDALHETG